MVVEEAVMEVHQVDLETLHLLVRHKEIMVLQVKIIQEIMFLAVAEEELQLQVVQVVQHQMVETEELVLMFHHHLVLQTEIQAL